MRWKFSELPKSRSWRLLFRGLKTEVMNAFNIMAFFLETYVCDNKGYQETRKN